MKMTRRSAMLLALAGITLAAPSALSAHEYKVGTLLIEHPWSRPSPMASNVSAGFLKITNTGQEDDRLVKATAEISPKVQLHDMKMEGDMMKMVELPEGIVIPAGKTVELKPKSLHIMFMDVKSQPVDGSVFKATLVFEKAGELAIDFMVETPK